jgi:hypothetical protein
MKSNAPITRALFIISVVVAVAMLSYLWIQFDNMSLVFKVFFSPFLVGILGLNARRTFFQTRTLTAST